MSYKASYTSYRSSSYKNSTRRQQCVRTATVPPATVSTAPPASRKHGAFDCLALASLPFVFISSFIHLYHPADLSVAYF